MRSERSAPTTRGWTSLSVRVLIRATPFLVGAIVWEWLASLQLQSLRYVVRPLSEIASSLYADLTGAVLTTHAVTTLSEVFWGFAIALACGTLMGVAIARSGLLEMMFYPIIFLFQAIPKVALAPLLIVVFGFGSASKAATAAMIGFFPILIGVITGLKAQRQDEIDLMRSLCASNRQVLLKVQVPRALPAFFGGLQVAASLCLIGAIVAEFTGATAGFGYLILFRSSRLDVAGVYSALVLLALIALLIDYALRVLGRRLSAWKD